MQGQRREITGGDEEGYAPSYACFPFTEDSLWWEVPDTACSKPDRDLPECGWTLEEPVPPFSTNNPDSATEPEVRPTAPEILEQKLDFIMATVKTRKCPESNAKGTRTRKSPSQIQVLLLELGHQPKLKRLKMKEVAAKTGLKELQVYKWFWDHKKRVKHDD